MARPDFRSQAARRLATERSEYTPALIDLLKPGDPTAITDVRRLPLDRISSNPEQPRQHFDEEALQDLAASIREHGVLQPVLVRPHGDGDYQIIAGERRWRAARIAGLTEIPVIVERIDDEAALEIAIIENLQREDISPLEEAEMFERMTTEHGYSLRKLATKLGKDKGYVENRLRIARAPQEIRDLVAERSDTLSAAYELMKVEDVRKRRRLARQVAAGELSLVKLRQRIEGRATPGAEAEAEHVLAEPAVEGVALEHVVAQPAAAETGAAEPAEGMVAERAAAEGAAAGHATVGHAATEDVALEDMAAGAASTGAASTGAASTGAASTGAAAPIGVASEADWALDVRVAAEAEGPAAGVEGASAPDLVAVPVVADGLAVDQVDIDGASEHLTTAVNELTAALLSDPALTEASSAERQRFAKYLTLAKIKLENAIAVVRAGGPSEPSLGAEAQLPVAGEERRGSV